MYKHATLIAAAALFMATLPAAGQASAAAPASSAGCKARAAGSPTHLYTYEKTSLGYEMREGRHALLKRGECLKTFGKTIEDRFIYHDDMGTTSDHSYYYYNPAGSVRYFYRLETTSQRDLSRSEVFVEDKELAHCPSQRCDELAAYDPQ